MRSISATVAVFTMVSWAEAGLRGGPIVERRRRMSSANELPQHGLHRPGKQPKEIHDLILASRARQLERRGGDGKIVQYESTDGSVVEYAMEREDVMEPTQAISGRFMARRPGEREKPGRKPAKPENRHYQQKGKDKKEKDKKDKKKGKKKPPKRKPKQHKIVAKKANDIKTKKQKTSSRPKKPKKMSSGSKNKKPIKDNPRPNSAGKDINSAFVDILSQLGLTESDLSPAQSQHLHDMTDGDVALDYDPAKKPNNAFVPPDADDIDTSGSLGSSFLNNHYDQIYGDAGEESTPGPTKRPTRAPVSTPKPTRSPSKKPSARPTTEPPVDMSVGDIEMNTEGDVATTRFNFVPLLSNRGELLESFENGYALDSWSSRPATNQWSIDNEASYDGNWAIVSGIPNNVISVDPVYSNLTLATDRDFAGGVLTFRIKASSLRVPNEALFVMVDETVELSPAVTASASNTEEWNEYSIAVGIGRHEVTFVHVYNPFSLERLPPSRAEMGLYMDDLRYYPFSGDLELGEIAMLNDGDESWQVDDGSASILKYYVETSTTAPHDDFAILINNESADAIFGESADFELRSLNIPKGKAVITLRHRKNPGKLSNQVLNRLGKIETEAQHAVNRISVSV
ncbi:hypothetical protein THAOC_05445 [Thalassiosira oceanica]|uniref:Uncharacterized protein n=1 Tax=Thalassiosira oceanica TaxID=159749 RepID=K0TH16_THAOC|nr:hypothetical protein THAOC_05445 [Thalassiosira oceanica]|eukprot:EJK72966.1 hypothetical protein THAOC_05445 [Thalassiosira oceanica]